MACRSFSATLILRRRQARRRNLAQATQHRRPELRVARPIKPRRVLHRRVLALRLLAPDPQIPSRQLGHRVTVCRRNYTKRRPRICLPPLLRSRVNRRARGARAACLISNLSFPKSLASCAQLDRRRLLGQENNRDNSQKAVRHNRDCALVRLIDPIQKTLRAEKCLGEGRMPYSENDVTHLFFRIAFQSTNGRSSRWARGGCDGARLRNWQGIAK